MSEERFDVVGNRSDREPYSILDSKKDGETIATLYDIEWAELVCALLNDNDGRREDS